MAPHGEARQITVDTPLPDGTTGSFTVDIDKIDIVIKGLQSAYEKFEKAYHTAQELHVEAPAEDGHSKSSAQKFNNASYLGDNSHMRMNSRARQALSVMIENLHKARDGYRGIESTNNQIFRG